MRQHRLIYNVASVHLPVTIGKPMQERLLDLGAASSSVRFACQCTPDQRSLFGSCFTLLTSFPHKRCLWFTLHWCFTLQQETMRHL